MDKSRKFHVTTDPWPGMALEWILSAAVGAAFAFLGRLAWDRWSRHSRRRPEGVTFHAAYQFDHDCLTFQIENQGPNEVEVKRLISQFHVSRRRRRMLSGEGSWFEPTELEWQNVWPEGSRETPPNKILPGGSGYYTAGNQWLARQSPKARWLTVQVFFADGTMLCSSANLAKLRRLDANWKRRMGTSKAKPGQQIIESDNMRMLLPSFPPKWVPAREVITKDDPRWKEE